ncbi:hypothetical protein RchiOBHm_Chr4g0386471 [Rosa chinensis]|uniref:Uncharacterized protein n=1 Tax=Rosa chinensis TaxID=74649 RepID=A0A2P6QPA8_ROSCH|nr:hypothetical protein RchiOBHm_Chr4g0386471 [Rosa chinensis]
MVNKFIVSKHKAIQQYALDLSNCLPPPLENSGLENSNSSVSHDETEAVSTISAPKPTIQATSSVGAVALRYPVRTGLVGAAKHIFTFMLIFQGLYHINGILDQLCK